MVLNGDAEADPAIRRELSGSVEGVLKEIEQDLGDLDFAAGDEEGGVHGGEIEADRIGAEAFAAEFEGLPDNIGNGGALKGVGGAFARDVAEAFHNPGDTVGGFS